MASLNVVPISPSAPLSDVPAQLRALAARLEAGEYGDINADDFVLRVACVIRATRMEPVVFGWGGVEGIAQIFMDLHAGAAELMAMKSPERT